MSVTEGTDDDLIDIGQLWEGRRDPKRWVHITRKRGAPQPVSSAPSWQSTYTCGRPITYISHVLFSEGDSRGSLGGGYDACVQHGICPLPPVPMKDGYGDAYIFEQERDKWISIEGWSS